MTSGCSIRQAAVGGLTSFLGDAGSVFASERDPRLVEDSLPFTLKMLEAVLLQDPQNETALLNLATGYTQYAYAFVETRARRLEETDIFAADVERARARLFYDRARDYAFQYLDARRPGFSELALGDPESAVASLGEGEASGLYWATLAWAASIGMSLDDPIALVDLPVVETFVERALALSSEEGLGDLYTFLVTFAAADPSGDEAALEKAESYFKLAVEATQGQQAGPYVALATAVCVPRQNRERFEELLNTATAVDVDSVPETRLANVLAIREAERLLANADQYFWR